MNCKFSLIGDADDGKKLHRCSRCNVEVRVRTDNSQKIYLRCGMSVRKTNSGRCKHLGDELRRQECPSCKGTVQVKVMGCAMFGECTIGKDLPGIECCAACSRHEPTELASIENTEGQ